MNSLDEKIKAVQDELTQIRNLYEFTQKIKDENEIEQGKIVEQNLTLKHQRDELIKSQAEVKSMKANLDEREKQILIREKSQINSNKLLDEKLNDFREKTAELAKQMTQFKKEQDEFKINRKNLDQKEKILKRKEEMDRVNINKIKNREAEIEKELSRLKNMGV